MVTKTGKTSHIDRNKLNSVLMMKGSKRAHYGKTIQLNKKSCNSHKRQQKCEKNRK